MILIKDRHSTCKNIPQVEQIRGKYDTYKGSTPSL